MIRFGKLSYPENLHVSTLYGWYAGVLGVGRRFRGKTELYQVMFVVAADAAPRRVDEAGDGEL